MRNSLLLALTVLTFAGGVFAVELVSVPSSSTKYPSETESRVGDKTVTLALTGTAMRSKFIINVYAVGSYIQQGVTVKSADELIAADCAKRLHLVMERTVEGKDMADAFRTAIRMNHAAPEFNDEINTLAQYMESMSAQKGDHIHLTHVPGVGLHCTVQGKADFQIKNPRFSQAIWEIYLGKKNLGDAIKKGLTSRL